ncbi:NF-kappa-B inhibitor zeta isoform X1 [Gouania willdenowi]|uniref:NF-kappa-B inhibitor zeta isoform X1 n=1 Tax=Gouania willdenowi TaxID=441366 RepID=UPI0010555C66|nr:NF-kappa-B inhibitor zeta-like isoform X1 [Gouania willdenowi]
MRNHGEPAGGEDDWSSAHSGPQLFWAQLQQEERLLSSISSSVLLSTDQHGRTALHKAASVGKRLLGYAIAKRMSALCRLDLRDCDGMTPLLYAAQNNHPLIVADLIYLGADVNVKNMSGKTLLHLSAERGYIRVLQAVKCAMMCGVYVDVEATDEAGMSVLQCAVLSMKASVCDSTSSSRVQDQMMETVECLLQMDSYLHTTKGTSVGSY